MAIYLLEFRYVLANFSFYLYLRHYFHFFCVTKLHAGILT